jgi:hypothetical protein
VEQQCQIMVSMLQSLKHLQISAGVTDCLPSQEIPHHNETEFDDMGDTDSASASASSSSQSSINVITVERVTLHLPSNGNVSIEYGHLELRYRLQQAETQVNRLRDLIADISFQYSHIIRNPVRKSVQTRGQKQVKSLHNNVRLHANIYSHCRGCLVALKCNDAELKKFRVLTKDDLKASTAILHPNEPGSSSLRLSWIWQTGRWYLYGNPEMGPNPGREPDVPENEADAYNLMECSCITCIMIFLTDMFLSQTDSLVTSACSKKSLA